MVYNEPEFVPLWARYYGRQFGEENLFIIDHGSSDGSLDDVGRANVIRIPRSPKDNEKRANAVSFQCAALLQFFDNVIQTDVDEFLLADPRKHESLAAYCAAGIEGKIVTSIGLNLVHLIDEEPDLISGVPVLRQRRWAQFISPMCKPNIVRMPVVFGTGFHGCSTPPNFSDLYMIHLRYYDKAQGLARLARTRAMQWAFPAAGQHQRLEDEKWIGVLSQHSKLLKRAALFTDAADASLSGYVDRVLKSIRKTQQGIYSPPKAQIVSGRLFYIPDVIADLF
ncbi:MAG: hypothetical protein DI629_14110 [Mesorhizobium amorphae]|nr:MAG: hypothetical protein DI629_14110 [Mesorhizobium amorphae]